MKLPIFPNFNSISSVTRETFESILPKGEESSDFQWLSLRVWNPNAQFSYLNGSLVIQFAEYHDNEKYFLSFCGGDDLNETATTLLNFAQTKGFEESLKLVPQSVFCRLDVNRFVITEDRDNHDYVYSTTNTFEASSRAYSRFRQARNGIDKEFGSRIRLETLNSIQQFEVDILDIGRDWLQSNNHAPFAVDEFNALQRLFGVLATWTTSNLLLTSGLFLDDKLIAFSIDEILNESLALGHFGHALRNTKHASSYLHWFVSQTLHKRGVIELNDEQDLGFEGLRRHKLLNHPSRMVKKYSISEK